MENGTCQILAESHSEDAGDFHRSDCEHIGCVCSATEWRIDRLCSGFIEESDLELGVSIFPIYIYTYEYIPYIFPIYSSGSMVYIG